MTCVVYGLKSSRDGEVRYVGQTTRSTSRRLTQHMYYARSRETAVHHWIMREIEHGFKIELAVLVSEAVFNTTEQEVIAECRRMGARLLNHTEGGGGVLGHSQSEETRRKKSIAAKEFWGKQEIRVRWRPTEEQKKKIGAANMGNKSRTGHKHSEETRQKMRDWAAKNKEWLKTRFLGVKRSQETREKISAAKRRYWEERRAQASV